MSSGWRSLFGKDGKPGGTVPQSPDGGTPPRRYEAVRDVTALESEREAAKLVVGSTSGNEILDVLLLTLVQQPERGDLWMMRFEIQRTLGLKDDFAQGMQQANANKVLRRNLDWATIHRLWGELAPGEPPPGDITPPKPVAPAQPHVAPPSGKTVRRFSDVALRLAGPELAKLAEEYQSLRASPDFFRSFAKKTGELLQRPTALHHAQALEQELGGKTRVYFKRGDTGGNTPEAEMAVAQACIASALGRKRLIAGQHGEEFPLALARVAPQFGLSLTVVAGPAQAGNPDRLRELGVELVQDDAAQDMREAALRLWMKDAGNAHLALSFGTGPNPYPRMVSDFQMLLGIESDLQLRARSPGRSRSFVAAVHSEADAIGFMLPYLKRQETELFYAEPKSAGKEEWKTGARLQAYHGAKREHAWLRATGRITHLPIADAEARDAQQLVKRTEGMDITVEDARAVVLALGLVRGDAGDRDIVVLVS